jgi:hypothetical protein
VCCNAVDQVRQSCSSIVLFINGFDMESSAGPFLQHPSFNHYILPSSYNPQDIDTFSPHTRGLPIGLAPPTESIHEFPDIFQYRFGYQQSSPDLPQCQTCGHSMHTPCLHVTEGNVTTTSPATPCPMVTDQHLQLHAWMGIPRNAFSERYEVSILSQKPVSGNDIFIATKYCRCVEC